MKRLGYEESRICKQVCAIPSKGIVGRRKVMMVRTERVRVLNGRGQAGMPPSRRQIYNIVGRLAR